MKKFAFLFLLALPFVASAAPRLPGEDNTTVQINNRVLAHVRDRSITVLDISKKLDMIFFQNYPEYASSPAARFQFYQSSWKQVLADMIHQELILADSDTVQLEIKKGEVRQELEETFGVNYIENLDKLGLSYDEAMDLLRNDIIIRRMSGFRAERKAFNSVTPETIRLAYQEYLKDHTSPQQWEYQVITIRDPNQELEEKIAKHTAELLHAQPEILSSLEETLAAKGILTKNTTVTVSPLYQHAEGALSPQYREILMPLSEGEFSSPQTQTSRKDAKKTTTRIFHLARVIEEESPSFQEVATQLQKELLNKARAEEKKKYIRELCAESGIDEMKVLKSLPDDFTPFQLVQN